MSGRCTEASAALGKTLLCWLALCGAGIAPAQSVDALQARYTALRPRLDSNHFNQPLYLESTDHDGTLQSDVYARIDTPFASAGPALLGTAHWCEVLILHLNVKNCRNRSLQSSDAIQLAVGRKFDQALADTYAFEFKYTVAVADTNYQRITLDAPAGPMGTSNYRIVMEVTPLDAARSFMHLSYAYQYGTTARLAMQGYLATIGRKKVGFTRTGTQTNGQPEFVGGQRGVVERNTMRYYLAIVAYLGALATAPENKQSEQRLNDWYSNIEKYPLQLHELTRQEYLDMKHREMIRQRSTS
jgi:hypothetical protein